MKKLILSLLLLGLAGCYVEPYRDHDNGYRRDSDHREDGGYNRGRDGRDDGRREGDRHEERGDHDG